MQSIATSKPALHEFCLTLTIELRLSSDILSFKGKSLAYGFIILYPMFVFHPANFRQVCWQKAGSKNNRPLIGTVISAVGLLTSMFSLPESF
ncbi:hypothetical protein BBH88_04285 [Planococcus antarcticus DSM 14505]|uniref:Uncharacterized protein n=1 Tax=Planococcus antarcticus DSM 14505 TaxID=1185653 RepID=A0ABN4RBX3_9BACL|nr:hypothetical protein BBH88_04285 [Planococcus antarcticus DSM 14505]